MILNLRLLGIEGRFMVSIQILLTFQFYDTIALLLYQHMYIALVLGT